jgi:hypothetical protein
LLVLFHDEFNIFLYFLLLLLVNHNALFGCLPEHIDLILEVLQLLLVESSVLLCKSHLHFLLDFEQLDLPCLALKVLNDQVSSL